MLTIAHFAANYYIPHGTPDPAALRTRLDRLVRTRLPAAAADRLHPPTADANAVYRIRHLEIDLWLDALGMDEGEIAQRWAALTLRAVTHALLYGAAAEVVRYENHAHFVAAFLGDLLAGRAWSRWMYEEFSPLRDLAAGQVAAHLLAARPELLAPVADYLARQSQLEPLIQQWQLTDIRLILRQGLGFAEPPAVLATDATLRQLLSLLPADLALESGPALAQARNTLRLLLAVIRSQPQQLRQPALLAIAHHLALIYSLWSRRSSPALWQALAQGEISEPTLLAPLLTSLEADLPQACAWLRAVLATAQGRTYLAHLIPVVIPVARQSAPQVRAEVSPPKARAAPVERVTSGFAGLALLLPIIRQASLYEAIGNAGIYQLLLGAVGRTLQPLAWGDAGVAWLAGISLAETELAREQTVAWPSAPWPENTDPADAADAASLTAWLALIMGRFARGVRGFAQSTPAYLAQQFLNLPGHLVRSHDRLEVFLSRAPLGIVLHMAGYDGEQGRVPWLDNRQLVIHLPEG